MNTILGLEKYIQLLEVSRRNFNLIGPNENILEHCQDCLAALDIFFQYAQALHEAFGEEKPLNYLDLGTGAGLPGIVLSLAFRQEYEGTSKGSYNWYLLERTLKKVRFLEDTITELEKDLGLELHTHVIGQDLQQCMVPEPIHIVTARAFRPLTKKIVSQIKRIAPEATLMLYKGTKESIEMELHEVHSLLAVNDVIKLEHPANKERHLVIAQFM